MNCAAYERVTPEASQIQHLAVPSHGEGKPQTPKYDVIPAIPSNHTLFCPSPQASFPASTRKHPAPLVLPNLLVHRSPVLASPDRVLRQRHNLVRVLERVQLQAFVAAHEHLPQIV